MGFKEGDCIRIVQALEAEIPQGSIMRSILYLIYASGIPKNPNIHTLNFDDDTEFLSAHENYQVEMQSYYINHAHQYGLTIK